MNKQERMSFPDPLLALTLWRPWPFAILALPEGKRKPIENRDWRPPQWLIGRRLVLHAGKKLDLVSFGAHAIAQRAGMPLEENPAALSIGLQGSVVVRGWVEVERDETGASRKPYKIKAYHGVSVGEAVRLTQSEWFIGPVAWVLDDPRSMTLAHAIGGQRKLWRLPADARELVIQRTR